MSMRCADQRPDCGYYPECFADVHHLWWPAHLYRGSIPSLFRRLPENKVIICRKEHDTIHAMQEPPEVPHRDVMIQAIRNSDVYIPVNVMKEIRRYGTTE